MPKDHKESHIIYSNRSLAYAKVSIKYPRVYCLAGGFLTRGDDASSNVGAQVCCGSGRCRTGLYLEIRMGQSVVEEGNST